MDKESVMFIAAFVVVAWLYHGLRETGHKADVYDCMMVGDVQERSSTYCEAFVKEGEDLADANREARR